jgi:hypothetical protein
MRKAFRHTGVLMMLGVVALGLVGAAYTLWFEDLQITTQASTGTFNADVSIHPWNGSDFGAGQAGTGLYPHSGHPIVGIFSQPIPTSFTRSAGYVFAHAGDFGGTFGNFPADKPPTVCDGSITTFGSAPANANDTTNSNQLTMIMSGLYPYAGCTYRIDFHNTGTVPMHITALAPVEGDYVLCNQGVTNPNDPSCTALHNYPNPPGGSDQGISVVYSNCGFGAPAANGQLFIGTDTPLQLETGEEATCDVTVLLDQGDNLEGKTIIASSRFRAHQWNEVVNAPVAP